LLLGPSIKIAENSFLSNTLQSSRTILEPHLGKGNELTILILSFQGAGNFVAPFPE
jgi:hypothetical protein